MTNYRVGKQTSEPETLRSIIDEQGSKLVRLAEDILDFGLSPIELLMIAPKDSSSDKFVVVEGNRRLAAMKLIQDPALAEGTSLEAAFMKLSRRSAEAPKEIPCVLFPDKQSGFLWIQRKHDTGLKGAGTEPWSAIAKVRADADQGKSAPAHDVLEFVLANASLDTEVRERVAGHHFPVTNLDRLLDSQHVRTELKLDAGGQHVTSTADKKWVLNILRDIVTVIAREEFEGKSFNVNDIYTIEKQKRFLKRISSKYDTPKKAVSEWTLQASTDLVSQPTGTTNPPTTRPNPTTTARRKLIPRECKIKPPTGRENDIYLELRKLEVEVYRNAVSILFRVFLEFSVEQYIGREKIASVNANDKFKDKVKAVANHMEASGAMNRKTLHAVKTALSNPDSIISITTLHAYVHNPNFHPIPNELKTSWDRLQSFIERLWS